MKGKKYHNKQYREINHIRSARKRNFTNGLFCGAYIGLWLEFCSKPVYDLLVFYYQFSGRFWNPSRSLPACKKFSVWRARHEQSDRRLRNHFHRCHDFLLHPLFGEPSSCPWGDGVGHVCRSISSDVILGRDSL